MDATSLNQIETFVLDGYEKLLIHLKQTYKITPFCEVDYSETPYLILRHDIDLSLKDALKMAKIEKKLGVKSTYFVLFSSRFYNPFEGENMAMVKQISEMGHEIGLHYHPDQFKMYKQNLETTLHMEASVLETVLGKKVHSIVRHGLWDRDPFATTHEYKNANHPYFRADLIVHDSDRAWVTLDGLHTLLENPPKRAQLLIHPENWQEDVIGREALLDRHFNNLTDEIFEIKKSLLDVYKIDPAVIQYDNEINKAANGAGTFKSNVKIRSNLSTRALLRYNLIHTRVGWNLHKLREDLTAKRRASIGRFSASN